MHMWFYIAAPATGTLDYMAPEVLINPCTRLEEQEATMELLNIRNIVPYTSKVDVWATGVLAYELVTGRPPFEVDNESETVKLILTSDEIHFPSCYSAEWANFVRCDSFVDTPAVLNTLDLTIRGRNQQRCHACVQDCPQQKGSETPFSYRAFGTSMGG